MANKILAVRETTLKFADSAQTPTKNLTLSALAAGAGRISAKHDFGSAAKSRLYEWRATMQWGTAPVVGESIDIYLSTSDGTNPDGEEGTADAALSAEDKLKNMHYIGSIIADVSTNNIDYTGSGFFNLNSQHASIVVFNNSIDALRTDTSVHAVLITPVPDEVQ